jgi:hypothetical protein
MKHLMGKVDGSITHAEYLIIILIKQYLTTAKKEESVRMSKMDEHYSTPNQSTAQAKSSPGAYTTTATTQKSMSARVEIPQASINSISANIRSNLPAGCTLQALMLSDGLEIKYDNSSEAIRFEIPGSVHVRDLRSNYKRILRRNVAIATNPDLSVALAAVAASVQSIFSQPEPVSCLSILFDGTLHICITNRDAKGAYNYAILLTRVSSMAEVKREDGESVAARARLDARTLALEEQITSINGQICALNSSIGNLAHLLSKSKSNLEATSAYVKRVDDDAMGRFDRAECTIKWQWRWIVLLLILAIMLQALSGAGVGEVQ